jgi:mono/diheme cytochrome c family protein
MSARVLAILALAAFAAGCSPVSESSTTVAAGGGALTGDAKRGAVVYSMNCAMCHGAQGVGGTIGPSLRGEHERLDYSALVSWIEDPQAPMPKLYPKFLREQQVFDVASYVQHL